MSMRADIEEILYTEEQLAEIVKNIGRRISADYKDKNLFMVSVLKGSLIFMADLMRAIDIPCSIDFLSVSSYGNGTSTSGAVRILKDLDSSMEGKDLLVVEDPAWVEMPAQLPGQVLLVFTGSNVAEGWAEELARRGYYRDFRWRSRGRAQQSALYCTVQPATAEMIAGYEKELDLLRDRMVRAERTCNEEAALIERLRSDLSLSRSHAKNLEKTLNEVTSSTFWKLTWPMRYVVSKSRQIWHTFPLFVLLGELRRDGISGVREHARARREYAALFPGNLLRADRFAPVELLVRQANDQPAGPKISIVVPLYNTPLDFLDEMLDSVVNQTYKNWELCCVDAGKDEAVGQHVQARAKADARIRYQKLEKNELIPGNTNKGFEMATGEYIALLDHDDLLHPCALWYAARAIAEQKADFVYTDEATFEGKPEHVVLYHFKPDFMLDNLRSNNYICHLTVFSRALMERAGGGERMEYNGSQDYELFLRLTEQAEKIVHIPHALYYWRSSPGSTAADISAKTYCIDAGIAALKAHYARCGIAVDDVALIPGTPGYYKTDYTIEHPGRVSILIPTCDHIRDLELCVDSIYARTTYPDFELILIENNSKQPETFRAYERMQKEHPDNLKVVTWEGKGFNYSALNNFGEQYATGEYLLLLNNDTEVITPNWLEEMVMYAQQKRVGCVGAKLLYPDDTIQHAGIGFGIGGVAGHLHKYFPAASDGYMGRLNYVQDVYGDTAACLLIRREIYDEMNGLDESYAVAFNDVDFCVRVREAGYTNVFTPFAQLYHYESKSRGTEDNPEKQKRFQGEVLRFQARWGDLLAAGDPCTNPNFDIQREDFTLKILPLE